jgi:ABC-type branched-subunit amino acid transport system ATPase component
MNVLDRLSTMPDTTKSTLPLLRVEGLSHAFGGQQVLQDVAVELHRGEVVLLRGANGSGKTTLLNILTGNVMSPEEIEEVATSFQMRIQERLVGKIAPVYDRR